MAFAALALFAGAAGLAAQQTPANNANLEKVTRANNQFAIDFFQKVSEPGKNVFVSPVSVSTALAMTFEGSRGETRKQMAGTLHFDMSDAERQEGFAALIKSTTAGPEKRYKLTIANALWEDARLRLTPEYVKTIGKYYDGNLNQVHFSSDPTGSLQVINKWVEDKTADKIKNLIHRDDIDALTKLILTNAIYFKGDWVSPFKEAATKDEDFHLAGGATVKAPLMYQKARLKYMHDKGVAAIELPYVGNDLSMIALLPDGDIKALENGLSVEQIKQIRAEMESQVVFVYLPRFKFDTRYQLADMLSAMGMPDAFSEGAADFAGMTGSKDLYIKKVIHQAYIDVNEKGSEAAAATAVVMDGKSVSFDMPETFRADKPFLFLIVHKKTGSILFMGKIANPKN